jgi:hypothetical protein
MPSTQWTRVGAALAALVLGYAVVVAQRALLGIFLAAVVYLLAWLTDRLSPGHPLDDMSRERTLAAGAIALAAIAYSVLIAANVLLGVVAAVTVVIVAWITSPYGPVARWLDGT